MDDPEFSRGELRLMAEVLMAGSLKVTIPGPILDRAWAVLIALKTGRE